MLLRDLLVVFGGDEDFVRGEGLLPVEVLDVGEGFFEGDQVSVLIDLHKSNLVSGRHRLSHYLNKICVF